VKKGKEKTEKLSSVSGLRTDVFGESLLVEWGFQESGGGMYTSGV
jgi:hypothetical protein